MPDPDAMLGQMRLAITDWERATTQPAEQRAAERFTSAAGALDDWLSHGGRLPKAWCEGDVPPSDADTMRAAAEIMAEQHPLLRDILTNIAAGLDSDTGRFPVPLGSGGNSGPGGPPVPVNEAGTTDREGTRRAECMGTAPHAEHEFNGGMWCPGLAEPVTGSATGEDVLVSLDRAVKSAADVMRIVVRRLASMRDVSDDEAVVRKEDIRRIMLMTRPGDITHGTYDRLRKALDDV